MLHQARYTRYLKSSLFGVFGRHESGPLAGRLAPHSSVYFARGQLLGSPNANFTAMDSGKVRRSTQRIASNGFNRSTTPLYDKNELTVACCFSCINSRYLAPVDQHPPRSLFSTFQFSLPTSPSYSTFFGAKRNTSCSLVRYLDLYHRNHFRPRQHEHDNFSSQNPHICPKSD